MTSWTLKARGDEPASCAEVDDAHGLERNARTAPGDNWGTAPTNALALLHFLKAGESGIPMPRQRHDCESASVRKSRTGRTPRAASPTILSMSRGSPESGPRFSESDRA